MKLGRELITNSNRLRQTMIDLENEVRQTKIYFIPIGMKLNLNSYRVSLRLNKL